MSDQTRQIDAPSDPASLDASVDALVGQLDAAAAIVQGARTPGAMDIPEPEIVDPPMGSTTSAPESPDALLNDISSDIERQSPGRASVAPSPRSESQTNDQAEIDQEADLAAFEAPSESELSDTAGTSEVAHPGRGAEIDRLDAALAAGADRVLAGVQADLDEGEPTEHAPSPGPSKSAVIISEAPFVEPEAEDAGASKPAGSHQPVAATPQPIVAESSSPETKGRTLADLKAAMLVPLRPIAALHEGLAEPTRQTIGYCAVITLFFASCVWGARLYRKPLAMEPVTVEHEFYDASTPAHGVTSPPKAEVADEAKGGHDAAKPDEHGKTPKKSSSSGHGDAHGSSDAHAVKKTSSSKAKKGAKTEASAEH